MATLARLGGRRARGWAVGAIGLLAALPPAHATAPRLAAALGESVRALEIEVSILHLRLLMREIDQAQFRSQADQAVARLRATAPESLAIEAREAELAGLARRYLSGIEAFLPTARWPADRPPDDYLHLSRMVLADVRAELAGAIASGGDVVATLAPAAQVLAWTQGGSDARPFTEGLDAAIDAAVATLVTEVAVPARPGTAGAPGGTPTAFLVRQAGPDLVSPGATLAPDGQPDGVFALAFTPADRAIVAIELYGANPRGEPVMHRWSTRGGGNWVMGVVQASSLVNRRGFTEDLGLRTGPLTLHIADPGGYFVPGNLIAAEITLDGGEVIRSSTASANLRPGDALSGGEPAPDPLGRVWEVVENGQPGTWTRRPGGNTFDASWPGVGVRAVLDMTLVGTRVTIARRQSSDGNDCDYIGQLGADAASGTYTCSRAPTPMPWSATIRPPRAR